MVPIVIVCRNLNLCSFLSLSQTKEVELQCRVEDLEKQTYRDNQIQARMEEVEAKLEALTLEKRRLESENCVLKTQVEYQQRVRAAQRN